MVLGCSWLGWWFVCVVCGQRMLASWSWSNTSNQQKEWTVLTRSIVVCADASQTLSSCGFVAIQILSRHVAQQQPHCQFVFVFCSTCLYHTKEPALPTLFWCKTINITVHTINGRSYQHQLRQYISVFYCKCVTCWNLEINHCLDSSVYCLRTRSMRTT